ncbi:hypothetical protein NC653_014132 [Populus alba x Populus x berolinensis]|uniref:C2 NT-type domain-containing protein n=1 Tax=Populus alba x Populus x berolinensis TaxID=444605 RepID=A0AAD6W3Z4_9ROSI|nr:hypothetical protein NC653_014132 [Populus alba x Populus x berolinensis]
MRRTVLLSFGGMSLFSSSSHKSLYYYKIKRGANLSTFSEAFGSGFSFTLLLFLVGLLTVEGLNCHSADDKLVSYPAMSRITRWKNEKTKVKVVFRLQFHATHIPHPGWDKLFISFIPADSGKATAKTTKANVRNGTCKWADPIYETTRLLQDVKTKRYDEKLYKLVISMKSNFDAGAVTRESEGRIMLRVHEQFLL